MKEFFPNNAVEYFVSYYDYYQPEAYVPQSDTYIAKDSSINDDIDKYMVDKNITNFINKYSIEIIKGEAKDFIPNLKEKFFDEKKSGDALQNFA